MCAIEVEVATNKVGREVDLKEFAGHTIAAKTLISGNEEQCRTMKQHPESMRCESGKGSEVFVLRQSEGGETIRSDTYVNCKPVRNVRLSIVDGQWRTGGLKELVID